MDNATNDELLRRIKVLEDELEDPRVLSEGSATQVEATSKSTHQKEQDLEAGIIALKAERDRAAETHRRELEKLQSAYDELEISNAYLNAANEKLQTSSKELATINEELLASSGKLEAANEELHATTEEYRTTSEELEATNEILRETETFLSKSFDQALTGIIIINSNGIVEKYNAAAQSIFRYSADEVIGQSVRMLMPASYANNHDGYIQTYHKTGIGKIVGIGREVMGLRKNGKEFPMQLSVAEMKIGDCLSFIGSVSDLTALKDMEKKLLQSQRMDAVGQLTGGVAHDFNNLLQVMTGNVEMLGTDGIEQRSQKNITAITMALERASSLTNRLLSFSRQQTLLPIVAKVTDTINSLEDLLRRTLGEAIILNIEVTTELWPAKIDVHQFENALLNLAINGRDAMPNGGTLTISTTNVTLDKAYAELHDEVFPGDYVEVSVTDTGTGISTAVLEKVFEPFFTTKEVGEGSGLGLSMVYGFAKQSGGHLSIDSELGFGTTVNLFLPRSGDVLAAEGSKIEMSKMSPGSERILVVEDDPDVREISEIILRSHGYEVAAVTNGSEAIEILEGDLQFDLLFTDIILPGGMTGVDISELAKNKSPDLKVLYTTGYAEKPISHHSNPPPNAIILNKPYRLQELLETIHSLLDGGDD